MKYSSVVVDELLFSVELEFFVWVPKQYRDSWKHFERSGWTDKQERVIR